MSEKMNISPLIMQILLFLSRHPDQEFYVREIATSINKSVGGTHSALKTLRRQRFVLEERSGKNLYYHVQSTNPSLKNFKIFMSLLEIRPLIEQLKKLSEKIILFGSVATGEDTADSDIDLFILTNEKESVSTVVQKRFFGREIQAVLLSASEYVKLKERDKAFYQEIHKGIVVWENVHEQ